MPWFADPFVQRWTIVVRLTENGPIEDGKIVNSLPRFAGTPCGVKMFQVAVDSVHGAVSWYTPSELPLFVMKRPSVAFTIVEFPGICPKFGPTIEGNLIRLLHTVPATLQSPLIRSLASAPKFVSGWPLKIQVSSTWLNNPPSPLRKLRESRSPITRRTVTFLARLAFVAATVRL